MADQSERGVARLLGVGGISRIAIAFGLAAAGATIASAQGSVIVQPEAAERFATLDVRSPRGITANPDTGELIVGTGGGLPVPNLLLRLDRSGRQVAQIDLGPAPILGVTFNPRDDKVYVAVAGALGGQVSKLQRIRVDFDARTALEDVALIPDLPAPAPRTESNPLNTVRVTFEDNPPFPNGIAFRESDGSAFVSDSLQGAIFRLEDPTAQRNLCPDSTDCVSTVIQDGRLMGGTPDPIGANGIAVSPDGSRLFVSNSSDDRLLSLDLTAAALETVSDGLVNFPDGLILGPGGSLVSVANLGNEIDVVDPGGRVLARLGASLGVDAEGVPVGLLGPAQAVLLGDSLFVTNFANAGGEPNPDVRRFTIARIRLPAALLQAQP